MPDQKLSVTFYGASDDLIEVEGDAPGCDEYPLDDATFLVTTHDGPQVRVRVRYTETGLWAIEVAQSAEDEPTPFMELFGERYTMKLRIYAVKLVVREATGVNEDVVSPPDGTYRDGQRVYDGSDGTGPNSQHRDSMG